MKKMIMNAVVMLIVMVFAGHVSAQVKTGFTGKWLIDTTRSELNRLPVKVASQMITVEVKGNDISILAENGATKNAYKNTLDGKSATLVSGSGSTIVSTIEKDGEASMKRNLEVSTAKDASQLMYTRKEIWSLSADGKVLSIKQLVTPGGAGSPYSFTAAYVRSEK